MYIRGPQWRSWLRHRATNWQVAALIPNGVSGFFHWYPVGRTMALGSTQALTETSTVITWSPGLYRGKGTPDYLGIWTTERAFHWCHYNGKIRNKASYDETSCPRCWVVKDWLALPTSPGPPVSECGLPQLVPPGWSRPWPDHWWKTGLDGPNFLNYPRVQTTKVQITDRPLHMP
jgi:hypothetical protein